ncbi:MAG: hypothetical protein RSE00_05215 [Clostridia bacterium]
MSNVFSIACTQITEVLQHLNIQDYKKIPQEEIDYYKGNSDLEYSFVYDRDKNNISKEAKAIILVLFRQYFASDKQNTILQKALKENKKNQELAKEKLRKDFKI